MNTHNLSSKISALALSLVLVFAALPMTVFAAEGGDGCAHVHDELCGFEAGTPCGHEHGEDCGYAEATPEIPCDMNCEGETHADGCSYAPAVPASECNHNHDEGCGYIETAPCTHIHNEICGGLPPTTSGSALGVNGGADTDCLCEILCTQDSVNADCPVCAEDFTLCDIPEQEPPAAEDTKEPQAESPSESQEPEPEPSTDEVETETTTPNGLAYSFEELKALLDETGTATLGASVTVPADEVLYFGGAIQTGEYGIRVEGYLTMGNGSSITGEGVSQPVVEMAAGSTLLASSYSLEQAPRISATGEAGCGLFLCAGYIEDGESRSHFLRITADGAGGIGVRSETSVNLHLYLIEAPDGTGVVCPETVSLFLCRITAGRAAVDAPGFAADTCELSPAGDGGIFFSRKIARVKDSRMLFAQGEPIVDFFPEHYSQSNPWEVTLRAEGYPDKIMTLGLAVDFPEIDTNIIGSYPLPITLDECWEAFDLLPEDGDLITVEVYDPEIPCFLHTFSSWSGGDYVDYYFAGDLSQWTLWRSDDEGETWYDYTDEAELEWDEGYTVSVVFSEPVEYPVLLVWEAEGIGESEVVRISWDGGAFSGDLGGDRAGEGRGETELPPDDPGDNEDDDAPDDSGDGKDDDVPNDPGNGDDPPTTQPPETQPTDPGDDDNPSTTPTPETHPTDPGDGEDDDAPDDSGDDPPTTPPPKTEPTDSGDEGDPPAGHGSGNPTVTPTPTPSPPAQTPSPTTPVGGGSSTPASAPAPASPAPSPRNVPAAKQEDASGPEPTAIPDEVMGDHGVTVSGRWLAEMIEAEPGSIPFLNGGLRVLLPASWLQSLAPGETDLLSVALWQPEEDSFTVSFAVNGAAVTDRPDQAFLLSLPWDGGPVSCVSADGETTEAVLADGRAEFALYEAGTYTLTEKAEPAAAVLPVDNAPPPPEPVALAAPPSKPGMDGWTLVLLIGGPIVVCAGAAFGIWRRRLVRR